MIIVKLIYHGDDITRVEARGHAGYAKHGKDIVCSAVSAIIQTALTGIIDISGERVEYVINEETGYLQFDVPVSQGLESVKMQAVLRAMALGLFDLEKGYKPYVKTEVNKLCL